MTARLKERPEIFHMPFGLSFADALVVGVLRRYGGTPEDLARVTLLLPNRRAVRTVREAFLRRSGGRPLILPALRPLGDVDEDELIFTSGIEAADLDLPPAVPPLWRQLRLTQLVTAWARNLSGGATAPAQAAELASALGRFLDEVQTAQCDFDRLDGLVAEDFAEHWQRTLQFLTIITRQWPEIVREAGFMDGAERRKAMLQMLAELWEASPPEDPVIAAGVLGGIPAADRLLAVVARLPHGAIVLPGLDRHMDDESWDAIDSRHPQFAVKELLEAVGAERREAADWLTPDEMDDLPRAPEGRGRLLSEAMRPAATTAAWRDLAIAESDLDGIFRIDAPSPREEAGAIALIMRETLQTPGKTCALVTPDRQLARRVAAELRRWGIAVDDSAGEPLRLTPPAVFLALTAEMVASRFAPLPLLSCLKHPLAAGGMNPGRFRSEVRLLERFVLRGPRPPAGAEGISTAIRAIEREGLRDHLLSWWERLMPLWRDFAGLMEDDAPLARLAEAHLQFAEALAATNDAPGAARLWAGDDGDAAAAFMEEVLDAAEDFTLAGEDYPAFLQALMSGRVVRPQYGQHPRLRIWGQIEARLQSADVVILGGLNEGAWPGDVGADPWLSRPMRAAFGLPALERRIGLAAHDFAMAAGAPQVVLTRAAKVEGTPTVPSRWLARLDAVLGDRRIPPHPALAWFAELDRPERVTPAARPAPRPPVAVRPRKLSVTQVQTWMRDPYAIYARHILNLRPLDPIDADPGAAEKGTIIHAILDRFLKLHPVTLPADALDILRELGEAEFGALLARPTVRAFWWPRFLHVAEWFVDYERARRAVAQLALSEGRGEMSLMVPADDGSPFHFTLTARADRIDRMSDGHLVIIDYKTGQAPKPRQLMAGFAPQLPLEAVMAEAGAFGNLPASPVAGLEFWRLHGGNPPAEVTVVKEVEYLKDLAERGLQDLVARFARAETPYLSMPRPEEMSGGDYDHLARIREWAGIGTLLSAEEPQSTPEPAAP